MRRIGGSRIGGAVHFGQQRRIASATIVAGPTGQRQKEILTSSAHVLPFSCGESLAQSIARRHDDMPECFGLFLQALPDLREILDALL